MLYSYGSDWFVVIDEDDMVCLTTMEVMPIATVPAIWYAECDRVAGC